ncbi:MAG: GNAT family N-acetyltransferase, partial [Thermoprotei archaeon]
MGSIIVREAGLEDLKGFLRLYAEFYNELRLRQSLRTCDPNEFLEDVKRALARDKVFLAESNDGVLIGFIRVSQREGCYWVEELYVRPKYRGWGIGRRLVKVAERYVAKHDPFIYIMVLPQDRRAMRFWLHMGYTLLNTIELAKNLKSPGKHGGTRPFPLL